MTNALFVMLGSVLYIWTLANINKNVAANQIEPYHWVMWLFIVVLFLYASSVVSLSFADIYQVEILLLTIW